MKKEKIKVQHNRKLFIVILLLIILLVVIIFYIRKLESSETGCLNDEDCAPSGCCHADSCVPAGESPVCESVLCSMDCSGPLDCGQGHCACVKGECRVTAD